MHNLIQVSFSTANQMLHFIYEAIIFCVYGWPYAILSYGPTQDFYWDQLFLYHQQKDPLKISLFYEQPGNNK